MYIRDEKRTDSDFEELARKFLQDNPKVKEALDLFGIAHDRYQQLLRAQQPPVFYTANSTIGEEENGELA